MQISKEHINKLLEKLNTKQVLDKIAYRTDTISQSGDTIKCFCPIHKETIFRSLSINVSNNTFKCGYTLCNGFKGGTILDLYAQVKGKSKEESILYWARELGMESEILSETDVTTSDEKAPEAVETPTLSPGKIEMLITQKLQSLDNEPDNLDIRN